MIFLLRKSRVKEHLRHEASGKTIVVHEHEDSRKAKELSKLANRASKTAKERGDLTSHKLASDAHTRAASAHRDARNAHLGTDAAGEHFGYIHHHQLQAKKHQQAGAAKSIMLLKRAGAKVIIFTTRKATIALENYLRFHGVPFDEINCNSDQPEGTNPGKPLADVYIDDRAIRFNNWAQTMTDLKVCAGITTARLIKAHDHVAYTRRSKTGKPETIQQKGIVKRKTPNATVILKPRNTGRQQEGITGKTDAELRTIAADRDIKIPPAWTDIWVNRDPSAGLQAKGRDKGGVLQRLYSSKHCDTSSKEKFQRVKVFAKAYPAIMKQVNADFDTSEEARVLYLISRSAFRAGGDKERGEVKSYGASNLQREHTEVKGSRISFSFTGKKGVGNEHIVTDKRLAEYVQKVKKGRLFKTDDAKVRTYLAKIGYQDFLVKDFRTHIANEVALATMAKIPDPKTPQEYKKAVKVVCEAVSNKLGNDWTMARDSYISPEVFSKWTK